MENKIIKSILPTVFAIMVLAIIGNSIQNMALAQSNSNSNETSGNQTRAEITGEPETTIINKTTIPAQQTTVTVNETTSPIDQSALQPLQNQTLGDAPVDLSGFENKTIVKPTGEAKTTTVNQTTVPFEKTIVEGSNQTGTQGQQQGGQQGQQQGNQTGTQGQQQGGQQGQKQQGNQSSGPLEKIGETITGVFK
jgi:hypothetical protein